MSKYANNEDYKKGAGSRKERLFPLQTKGDEIQRTGKRYHVAHFFWYFSLLQLFEKRFAGGVLRNGCISLNLSV
jgi:hypothetical protein